MWGRGLVTRITGFGSPEYWEVRGPAEKQKCEVRLQKLKACAHDSTFPQKNGSLIRRPIPTFSAAGSPARRLRVDQAILILARIDSTPASRRRGFSLLFEGFASGRGWGGLVQGRNRCAPVRRRDRFLLPRRRGRFGCRPATVALLWRQEVDLFITRRRAFCRLEFLEGTLSTCVPCLTETGLLASETCRISVARCTSSSVARKADTSVWGRWRMKPTVSEKRTFRFEGSSAPRSVGSRVANIRDEATTLALVRALSKVDLPVFFFIAAHVAGIALAVSHGSHLLLEKVPQARGGWPVEKWEETKDLRKVWD